MWSSAYSLVVSGGVALLILAGPLVGYPMPFPMAFPYALAELSELGLGDTGLGDVALGAGLYPAESCSRVHRGDPTYPGYFPDLGGYVDEADPREPGPGVISFVGGYPVMPTRDYVPFGAPEAGLQEDQEDVLEDDRPMPGDAEATVDSGRESEPLGEGERLVDEAAPSFDDTELIPLAGREAGPDDHAGAY